MMTPEWTGAQCPIAPDACWIDDATGEHVNAHSNRRTATHVMETTFYNVTITIEAENAEAAYTKLCEALHPFGYATDTYERNNIDVAERETSELFPKEGTEG